MDILGDKGKKNSLYRQEACADTSACVLCALRPADEIPLNSAMLVVPPR